MAGPRLVVVGGGVAGLAAARTAVRAGLPVTLLEAEPRLGGKVFTEMVDGVPWEWGPDALVATKSRGRDLLEELGLIEEAVSPATGRAYLLLGGELRPLPAGIVMGIPTGPAALRAAVRGGILTRGEALRALMEPLLPRRRTRKDVEAVARTRLGVGVGEKLVQPLVAAVYGDPDQDWQMVFPDHPLSRSLMLGARRRPPVRFLGLRGGMGTLVGRMLADLADADVRTGVRVHGVEDLEGTLTVRTDQGPVEADGVLIAIPAPGAQDLLRPLTRGTPFPSIGYSQSAVFHLRYPEGALGRPLDAAGYVTASREPGVVRACSWVTAKWPHLEERGAHLRAVVVRGHALDPQVIEGEVVREVGRAMRASRDPDRVRAALWSHALPVYRPGHEASVAHLRRRLPKGLEVAGASYEGIGIPDCVASGEAAVRRVLRVLHR